MMAKPAGRRFLPGYAWMGLDHEKQVNEYSLEVSSYLTTLLEIHFEERMRNKYQWCRDF
jgi:hypothetical protein